MAESAGTRTATLLFTDLVDSTAIAERLGRAGAEELRQEHFGLLRSCIATHGGREVKNLGDGLMAAFEGVASAIDAAVAIQQQASQMVAADHALSIRIGIAVGDVAVDSGDYFGPAVTVAARLCAAAAGGQILLTELGRLLYVDGDHTIERFGEIDLKGLADPVPAAEVLWTALDQESARVPLPPRLRRVSQVPFVGRDAESSVLEAAWKRACDGSTELALLGGEPGVGKTSIAREFAHRAHAEGAIVALGTADEDLVVAYGAVTELLTPVLEHLGHVTGIKDVVGRPSIVQLLGGAQARRQTGGDPEAERMELFRDVDDLLTAVAAVAPVLIVLDDVHWADRSTMLLLRHLLRSGTDRRVLILGTYRNTDVTSEHPLSALIADAHRSERFTRILLKGITDLEVIQLMERVAGHELTPDALELGRTIFRETDGLPFFVIEILRHLRDSGSVVLQRGHWQTSDESAVSIPESIRDVVNSRVARLGPRSAEVLSLASVLGQRFDFEIVRQLVGGDTELLSVFEDAVTAAVLLEVGDRPGRFAFVHRLIRSTLYDQLSITRRASLHRRIAEILEAREPEPRPETVIELAHHWCRAIQPGEEDKAIGYVLRAGDIALRELAYEDAAVHFERALELTSEREVHVRADLFIRIGDARRRSGDAGFRTPLATAFDLAEQVGSAELMLAAALHSARVGAWFASAGEADLELIGMYERTLDRLTPETGERARLLGAIAVESVFVMSREDRAELCDEAERIARRLEDPETLVRVLISKFISVWDPASLADRHRIVDELLGMADALDAVELTVLARLLKVLVLFEAGDAAALNDQLETTIARADHLRVPALQWLVALPEVALSICRRSGDFRSKVQQTTELGEAAGQPDALAAFGTQQFVLSLDDGTLAEIVDLVGDFVESMPRIPAWRAALALALWEAGRDEEALVALQDFVESDVPLDWAWLACHVAAAYVAAELGSAAVAETLAERLRPYSGQVALIASATASMGPVDLALARLAACRGEIAAAEEYFESALSTSTRFGAGTWSVRTRRCWAQLVLGRDPSHVDGTAMATAALADAQRLGMAGEARRLTDMLRHRR